MFYLLYIMSNKRNIILYTQINLSNKWDREIDSKLKVKLLEAFNTQLDDIIDTLKYEKYGSVTAEKEKLVETKSHAELLKLMDEQGITAETLFSVVEEKKAKVKTQQQTLKMELEDWKKANNYLTPAEISAQMEEILEKNEETISEANWEKLRSLHYHKNPEIPEKYKNIGGTDGKSTKEQLAKREEAWAKNHHRNMFCKYSTHNTNGNPPINKKGCCNAYYRTQTALERHESVCHYKHKIN